MARAPFSRLAGGSGIADGAVNAMDAEVAAVSEWTPGAVRMTTGGRSRAEGVTVCVCACSAEDEAVCVCACSTEDVTLPEECEGHPYPTGSARVWAATRGPAEIDRCGGCCVCLRLLLLLLLLALPDASCVSLPLLLQLLALPDALLDRSCALECGEGGT